MHWTEEDLAAYNARKLHQTVREGEAMPETERTFMARIVKLAHEQGYLVYHTHDSRHSAAGFPDLVLAKAGAPLLLVEVKTNQGKPTMAQVQWLNTVQLTQKPEAMVWHPRDWEAIHALLTAPRQPPLPEESRKVID